MFGINEDIHDKYLNDIPVFIDFLKKSLIDSGVENQLIEIEGKKMVTFTAKTIEKGLYSGKTYILLFKDLTEIISLERTLRKQLEKRGHIAKYTFSTIYGNSTEIKECIKKAKIIAGIDRTALIVGESGTGKELFAQSIHNESSRRNFPFVGINCAALPNTLLESELFGYEDGTFTGGKKGGKQGLFETANNGTIFLDEIGDMPLETQAKLLRVIEEKEIMRLGSNEIISVNVRIIAATNKNLKSLINNGKFRLDLYYRLNTLILVIPPLRKRKDDLIYLINEFLSSSMKKPYTISDDVYDFLINFQWEGNVRELKNCIDYIVNMTDGNITMKDLPEYMFDDIYENKYDNDSIIDQLSRLDQEILLDMMEMIDREGGGRRSLYRYLKSNYANISEYKVRNLIELLSKFNLIEIKKGSSGIALTKEGKKLLSDNL
jgi:transcriptional regulator with PAS, ATPase and Fis domain